MIARVLADEGAGLPVLYLPGIDGSGELLLDTTQRLAARFRLMRLCYRPEGADDYESLAATAATAVEQAGLPPAIVLAESFGVAVALQLALDHPERVKALVLVNGFAHFPNRTRLMMSRWVSYVAIEPVFRAIRSRLGSWALLAPRRDPVAWAAFKAFGGVRLDAGYRRRLRMIRRLDLRSRLACIEVPVALFASDRDRVVPSIHAAREMRAALPAATLDVLRDAGHVVLPLSEEPWEARLSALAERAGVRPNLGN